MEDRLFVVSAGNHPDAGGRVFWVVRLGDVAAQIRDKIEAETDSEGIASGFVAGVIENDHGGLLLQ